MHDVGQRSSARRLEAVQGLDLDLRADAGVVGVLAQREDDVVAPRLADRLQAVEVEVHGAARGAVAAHAVLQVPAVAREPRRGDLGAVQQQAHAPVAEAVRREQLELVGELEGELVAADDRVGDAHAGEVVGAEHGGGVRGERLAKGRDGAPLEPQAARRAVPAVGDEVLGRGVDPGEQVEGGDAAPRTLGEVAVLAQQDRRAVEALGDPRGDDADDALVPVRRREHERRRQRLGDLRDRRGEDAAFDLLALVVELVEAQGERQRRLAVLAAEQLEGDARRRRAARRR